MHKTSKVLKLVAIALGVLLLLQFSTGLVLIFASKADNIVREFKSLGLVISILIMNWYIWLIPFYLFIAYIHKLYTRKKYALYYYVIALVLMYFIYFAIVYRGNFWQLSCVLSNCKLSEWIDSEKRDLFFNVFSLISLIYYSSLVFRSKTNNLTTTEIT